MMSRSWKTTLLVLLALGIILFAYYLRAIFTPLLVALLIAYILNPLIDALERRRVPRVASIAGLYVVLIGLAALLAIWGIPKVVTEGRQFVRETITDENAKIHKVILWGGTRVKDWMGAENWEEVRKNLQSRMKGHEGDLAQAGGKIAGSVVSFMTQSVSGFLTVVSSVVLVPVYLFFILKNMNRSWEKLRHAIPRAYRERTLATLGRIHRANAAFFRGQLTISLIEGTIIFLALLLMGVKFSFLFGSLYAVLSIIPFLGVVVGFAATEIFVLADTGGFTTTFFLVAGLFMAIQALEASVLQPMILGKETGLAPIGIILALLICGELFGIFGMLIAVPIASSVKILFEDYIWPMFQEVSDLTRVIPREGPAPPDQG
jgi:predicted PurR-regulated permease PerM